MEQRISFVLSGGMKNEWETDSLLIVIVYKED